jgi:phosphoribosyl 1,2-cyclic phosphodiesterase
MSLFVASINSGSNGNCYYVGNSNEAVLIDAGISCRETEKRMARIGLNMRKVKAIFISHEHSDHIRGVEVLSKKYQLPVYITERTYKGCSLKLASSSRLEFKAYESVRVGDLSVTAFPKFHDAADPHSFIVEQGNICVGVLTDIGSVCEHVITNFKKCNAVFLEANYDEKMLQEGSYPYHLKQRIRSSHGHLSNDQALELFSGHKSENMSHVFLSHLSRDNNSPQLVEQLFNRVSGTTAVVVASRYQETEVYCIRERSIQSIESQVSFSLSTGQINMF